MVEQSSSSLVSRFRRTCEVVQVVTVELGLDGRHAHRQYIFVLRGQELGQRCIISSLWIQNKQTKIMDVLFLLTMITTSQYL